MIYKISESAPKKFRRRAKLLMEANASWIFASSFTHIWFAYLMLRYAWKIPKNELKEWKINIKTIYGKYSNVYVVAAKLANFTLMGFFVLLCTLPFR
ncbi:hypothetical protein VSP9026_03837 [Vibrio spartinae]|uniref:Uncharacterized protein n=1 Tax=Vibrio spartinae TaxID=1918945 RepID=A0A1N6M9G3_9VIBR|nr:hypothetical protein VSP9026_03837 [Vibrio spartinae]